MADFWHGDGARVKTCQAQSRTVGGVALPCDSPTLDQSLLEIKDQQ